MATGENKEIPWPKSPGSPDCHASCAITNWCHVIDGRLHGGVDGDGGQRGFRSGFYDKSLNRLLRSKRPSKLLAFTRIPDNPSTAYRSGQ